MFLTIIIEMFVSNGVSAVIVTFGERFAYINFYNLCGL